MLRSLLARALAVAPLVLVLAAPVRAQYSPHYPATPSIHAGVQLPVQTAPAAPACASCGSCGYGCTTLIGPNVLTGLAAWIPFKTAKANCCGPTHHCGSFVHCQPKPPDIRFPRVCGPGVSDPCTWEHFGYYNTCWAPWGYPPDYHHCPTPQYAAVVPPSYPRTEYFSPDPRAQQPGLVEEDPMREPMREREPTIPPRRDPMPEKDPESGRDKEIGATPIPVGTFQGGTFPGGPARTLEPVPQTRPVYNPRLSR